MPNSRRRMFHTCAGMLLFTVCNTLRGIGSPTVQDRLRRPHNNIRPHFSSPSPYVLSSFCQIELVLSEAAVCALLGDDRNMCAASDQGEPRRRLPRRLSPEAAHSPAGPNQTCQVCEQETATCNSFTFFFFFEMMRSLKQGAK